MRRAPFLQHQAIEVLILLVSELFSRKFPAQSLCLRVDDKLVPSSTFPRIADPIIVPKFLAYWLKLHPLALLHPVLILFPPPYSIPTTPFVTT